MTSPAPELVVGTPATVNVYALAGSPSPAPARLTGIPPGLADDGTHKVATGTPTEAGTFTVKLQKAGTYGGFETYAVIDLTVAPQPEPEPVPELVVGTPATVNVYALAGSPAAPGGLHRIGGLPPGLTDDGTHKVATGTPTEAGTFTVKLYEYDRYSSTGRLVGSPVELVVDPAPVDPDPDPDPDPGDDPGDDVDPWDEWDELTTRLAPRVAAYVGRPGDADVTATASAQLPVVAEYVRGYTRGRGFEGERPAAPLRAVIVAATARLATNPEQVTVFTTGDYSERPAVLAGWTLTELGVLRRYRRTSA